MLLLLFLLLLSCKRTCTRHSWLFLGATPSLSRAQASKGSRVDLFSSWALNQVSYALSPIIGSALFQRTLIFQLLSLPIPLGIKLSSLGRRIKLN